MINWLHNQVTTQPDNKFIIWKEQTFSFRQFAILVRNQAKILSSLKVGAKHRIGLLQDNPLNLIITFFACQKLNLIPVLFSPKLTSVELKPQIELIKPKLVVVDSQLKLKLNNFDFPRTVLNDIKTNFRNLKHLTESEQFSEQITIDRDEVCAILFTSGSTGKPKAVQLTSNNFSASVAGWHELVGFSSKDHYLACLPLTHIGGLSIIMRALKFGFQVTLMEKFDATTVNKLCNSNHISLISLIPTMLKRLLENRESIQFPDYLRYIILGGGPVSENLLLQCFDKQIPLILSYGMTETCSGIAGRKLASGSDNKQQSNVGRAFNDVHFKIENSALVVRAPMVMKGYVGEPDCEGVHQTGDLGWVDKYGNVFLDCRREDLIVTGGENVNPFEVEMMLLTHPEILECAVIGVADDEWGQKVMAYVVVNEIFKASKHVRDNLKAWCKNRIADFKIPKEFIYIDELPKNSFEKIDRKKLLVSLT